MSGTLGRTLGRLRRIPYTPEFDLPQGRDGKGFFPYSGHSCLWAAPSEKILSPHKEEALGLQHIPQKVVGVVCEPNPRWLGRGGCGRRKGPQEISWPTPSVCTDGLTLAMRYGWTTGSTPGHKTPGHKAPSATGNAPAPFLLSAGFPTGFFLSKSCRRP